LPCPAAAMCTVVINVLEPGAFNPKSQYFIPWFNKISWLCGQRPGLEEVSNEGCNSGRTGYDFTDNSNNQEKISSANYGAGVSFFKTQ